MEQTDQVTITIDGRELKVPKGILLVEAAKTIGMDIPVFCYHPKMVPVGACRMCLVQIEKMPRLQTACTTPVADGMVVHTANEMVASARRGVLELLLANHPLDCPVCDKGGECPLQDITFEHGPGVSRFIEPKRHFEKPLRLNDYIVLDRERCIMCYRCVRFQSEIAGDESLTVLDRGSHSEIGVAPGRTFDSLFSGNTIELCPVGALTSHLYRFKARPWDIQGTPSICTQCSVGCNVTIHTRDHNRIVRLIARENTPVDDGWLCDRGRFTYEFANPPESVRDVSHLDHRVRLRTPLVRRHGDLVPCTWAEALAAVAEGLNAARRLGPSAVAGIASTELTNEELYLFQKLLRYSLGSNDVEAHPRDGRGVRINGLDALTGSIADVERADVIVILMANPIVEQPVLDLRIKKAQSKLGAKLVVLHPEATDLAKRADVWLQTGDSAALAALAAALGSGDSAGAGAPAATSRASAPELQPGLQRAVDLLKTAQRPAVFFSRDLDDAGLEAVEQIASRWDLAGRGVFGGLVRYANSQGAIDLGLTSGSLPGQRPFDDPSERAVLEGLWGRPLPGGAVHQDLRSAITSGQVKALYLCGPEPFRFETEEWHDALEAVEFLVVQDTFLTRAAHRADVVLPAGTWVENEGTYTNLERRVQRIRPAMAHPGEVHANWRILRDLGRALGDRYDYNTPADIFSELGQAAPMYLGLSYSRLGAKGLQWPLIAAAGATESVKRAV